MFDPTVTPHESNHPSRIEQSANIALGKIMEVDVKMRRCTVATITGRGSIFDQWITDCQWLSPDANPEGDEFGSIPRRGSWGIVYFLDGVAFIGNYARPVGKGGSTLRGNESAVLNPGDKIISTQAKNRVAVKGSGLIELYVSETLKRSMLPSSGLLIDHCSNYDFKSNGGFFKWLTFSGFLPPLQNVLWRAEYYSTTNKGTIIEEKKGYVNDSIVYKRTIGEGAPGVSSTVIPVYMKMIGTDGTTTTAITIPTAEGSPLGYKSTLNPDGSVEILMGSTQGTVLTVDSSGAVILDVNGLSNLALSESGDLNYTGPKGLAEITAQGAITIANESTEIVVASGGDVTVTGPNTTVSIAEAGDVEIAGPKTTLSITADGDVSIAGPAVNMDITAGGDLTIKGSDFTLSLTASGEVKLESSANIAIESTGGGVSVKGVGPVDVEATGGDINIKSSGQILIAGGGGSATDSVLTNPTTLSPFTGAPLAPFSQTVKVSV